MAYALRQLSWLKSPYKAQENSMQVWSTD